MNKKMKNAKSNEVEINISVVGLSGSERDKGVKGAGKSCLCNRLAQPNHYKPKHSSIVSSIDFYGSEMNNTQWLFWGCVEKDIRGRKCRFRFIEQTVMVDDISHCAVSKKEDYIKRATTIELHGTKIPHIVGPAQSNLSPLSGKTTVHLFLLIYDVSNVEGRDANSQDVIFKQLFDSVIFTKRPVIVVTTKHDQAFTSLVDRLNNMLDKRPYNRYPVVETSASLGINVDHIFELAAALCDSSTKTTKPKLRHSFQEAFHAYEASLGHCLEELKRFALLVMDSEKWHSPWLELKRLKTVESWINRVGAELVETTFDSVRLDVRLKRRVVYQQRHKECLLQLLSRSHHLPPTYKDMETVVDGLIKDEEFMTNFISFDRDAEYFDFENNNNLLPRYILDKNNENNLIFVIKEYMDQVALVNQLLQRLIKDCPGNFRKSKKEIGEELKQHVKHFIPDKIVSNVYEMFQEHYFRILESQFLETLHQYPKLFWTQGIFKSIDIIPSKPPALNGISRKKSSNDVQHDSNTFLSTMTKEINSKIKFPPLSLCEDGLHMRESWIMNYLHFLFSANELECIYGQVTRTSCNHLVICPAVSEIGLPVEEDQCHAHISYIVIIGKGPMTKQLKDLIMSVHSSSSLNLCKVHSSSYEIKLLDNIDILNAVITELCERGDKCSSLCVLICADDAHLQSIDIARIVLLERNSTSKLAKYIVHSVKEEMVKVTAYEDDSSLYEDEQEPNFVHFTTLLSDNKKLIEPSIIWVVTVCGDLYDYDGLLTALIKVLKLHSIPRRMNNNLATISGCFTSKEIDRHKYRLCFISYHQAMKALIRSPLPSNIDGLLLVCSLDRLASLKTCLGIKKYLPPELKPRCNCLLLGIVGHSEALLDSARIMAHKQSMMTTFITMDNLKQSVTEYETENQILNFFINVFKGSPVTESQEDISTNTSSLKSRSETRTEGSIKSTGQYVCKACGQYKSYENINNNIRMSESTRDTIFDVTLYEQILGETNAELFDNCHPEFNFHETQDPCVNCTIINCSLHQPLDSRPEHSQVFRTRMRSQSGPDLRNSFDSNKSSLNKSDSVKTYCSACGAKMSSSIDVTDSRKLYNHKLTGDKESPSKKIATLFQDIFSSGKKLNESQSQESRKSFTRASSKRRK